MTSKQKKISLLDNDGGSNDEKCTFLQNYPLRYALFDAAVYIADSEQDKPLFNTQLVGHAKPRATKKRKAIS